MSTQWANQPSAPDRQHVYPLEDSKAHVLDGSSCWCNPHWEHTEAGWIVIHQAGDGRQSAENNLMHGAN